MVCALIEDPNKNASWPRYSEEELEAVTQVLRSGQVNQWTGEHVFSFQKDYANYCQAEHAIAVANGSLALELALRALRVSKGDDVIVTSRSFIASASSIVLCGANPVFADVDANSQNISAATIAPLITKRTKAIICVHLAGWPCNMQEILSLAKDHNLLVIEDCAQAHGAEIDGKPVGSFGDAAAFSFCQDKIISTGGEGGMVLFRDGMPRQWANSYKDHGKKLECFTDSSSKSPTFSYVHDDIGTNFRMTEMQAVIGRIQLGKLDEWNVLRRHNAMIWQDALGQTGCLRTPSPPKEIKHAYYKYYAFVCPEKLKENVSRIDILSALKAENINVSSGSCPEIYREKAFSNYEVSTRPVAHELGQTSLMFEVHPTLSEHGLRKKAELARDIISRFSQT